MAEQTDNGIKGIRDTLEKMGGQFKTLFPTQEHVDRFIRVVMTAVQTNAKLASADRQSFYSACMKSAQDGLMPDGKEAVLKIYQKKDGNAWVDHVGYEPMAEGLMKKLRLSGEVIGAPKVHVVYQGDQFTYELGDNERIVHVPVLTGRGEIIAAYSIVKLKSGDTSREVMSVEELNGIMNRTKSKDREGNIVGPWKTDKAEMCRKTVFKRHTKRLPRSTDLDNIINDDNEMNGIDLVEPARAAPVNTAAPHKPAILTAVAGAGGTPVPEMRVEQAQRETVTVENEASQKQGGQAGDGSPPTDII